MKRVLIRQLNVYPVKSCRAIPLDVARLGERGLEHDREWMIVDARGRFVTQRTHPRLARVVTAIEDGRLRLSAEGHGATQIPLDPGSADGPPLRRVTVWGDEVDALPASPETDRWLSELLGESLALVRSVSATRREPGPEWRGRMRAPVNFPDAYPLLVCSMESLAELNERMPSGESVDMARFRPNVVIEGLAPFEEDSVLRLAGAQAELALVKPCTRCSTTTVDQTSGELASNPLPVLRTFRFDRRLKGVTFGQNAVIVNGVGGSLHVGETLRASFREQQA